MQFPATDRVIYKENPLKEVACQITFPRIFSVDEKLPAMFQEKLGGDYPFVETREVVQFSVGFPSAGSAQTKRVHYDFRTIDKSVTVTLTSDSILIQTSGYERWESFSKHILSALSALSDSYSVPVFTRIGLRYVDVISRESLGLADARWTDLIMHAALGFLAEDAVPIDDVLELSSTTVLSLQDGGKVALRAAVGRLSADDPNTVFVWDSDFFEDQPVRGKDDAFAVCSKFNRSSGSAFRWIITKRLHDALGPAIP